MIRLLPFVILAVSACVTAPTERPLTVREIVENAEVLDGKEVVVSGWLEKCQHLSCGIFDSANEVDKDFSYYLSIGPSPWFDSFAQRAAPGPIVLRARIHDRCISNPATQIIAVCADRPSTLVPLALVR